MKKTKVFQVVARFLVNANSKKEALSKIELGTEPYRMVAIEVNPSSLKIK